jgi:hypothetical protein
MAAIIPQRRMNALRDMLNNSVCGCAWAGVNGAGDFIGTILERIARDNQLPGAAVAMERSRQYPANIATLLRQRDRPFRTGLLWEGIPP